MNCRKIWIWFRVICFPGCNNFKPFLSIVFRKRCVEFIKSNDMLSMSLDCFLYFSKKSNSYLDYKQIS